MSSQHPWRMSANKREAEVCRLRLHGHSFSQIARALGLSEKRVSQMYARAFEKTRKERQECAEMCVQMELRRLDEMHKRVYQEVIETKEGEKPEVRIHSLLEGVDRLIKIQERRAKLLGLDQPEKKVEVTMGIDLNQLSEDELKAELEKMGMDPTPTLQVEYKLPGEVVPQLPAPQSQPTETE